MKILFLPGWTSAVGRRKSTYLVKQGHEATNAASPDEDFKKSVRIAEVECDKH